MMCVIAKAQFGDLMLLFCYSEPLNCLLGGHWRNTMAVWGMYAVLHSDYIRALIEPPSSPQPPPPILRTPFALFPQPFFFFFFAKPRTDRLPDTV